MAETHSSSLITPKFCPDCGPAGVSHFIERWSVRTDAVFQLAERPLAAIWRLIKPAVALLRLGRLAPPIARALASVGVVKIIVKPDDENNWRARVAWEEAARRGILMREIRPFGLAREIFYAKYKGDTYFFDGLPRPRAAHEASLNWMDDKSIILKKFHAAGIPVPRGAGCTSIKQAEKIFNEIVVGPTDAVIAKPSVGSRSRHTYMHITDLDALRHAFIKAQELSPKVVIEEELVGFVFRITLIGGKIEGVMRREPPHVMGDGTHTIKKLAEEENKNPMRRGPHFHELDLGEEAVAYLATQNLTLDSIPKKDQMIVLHPKVSRTFGASNTEITDIHPDNTALFLHIAKTLDDPLVGVDFIIDDMARSWREQKCGVIECNSLPFIDLHHFPLKGPVRNTAGALWDLIFPGSRK